MYRSHQLFASVVDADFVDCSKWILHPVQQIYLHIIGQIWEQFLQGNVRFHMRTLSRLPPDHCISHQTQSTRTSQPIWQFLRFFLGMSFDQNFSCQITKCVLFQRLGERLVFGPTLFSSHCILKNFRSEIPLMRALLENIDLPKQDIIFGLRGFMSKYIKAGVSLPRGFVNPFMVIPKKNCLFKIKCMIFAL